MNEILQSELGAEIKSSPVIAFACDESTDVSVKENMVVYVYYIKNGEAKTVFLGMVNIKGAATAANLKAALKSALDVHGVYARAVAFGADGASAMLGINGGVAAKLRDDGKSHLLVFHCVCHRLALLRRRFCQGRPVRSRSWQVCAGDVQRVLQVGIEARYSR